MITWLKRIFESERHKKYRLGRKDLHENRNETAKSIATARQSGKKSTEALKVAEQALRILEKHRDGLKQ